MLNCCPLVRITVPASLDRLLTALFIVVTDVARPMLDINSCTVSGAPAAWRNILHIDWRVLQFLLDAFKIMLRQVIFCYKISLILYW